MKIEEIINYTGTNPKPKDFDSFWRQRVKQAKEHDPHAEFYPAQLKFSEVRCFDLYFQGVDGSRIHSQYLCPEKCEGKVPLIFRFHGYTGNSGDWSEKLSWVQQGFAVCAMDCRGQSGLSEDRGGYRG